MSYPSLFRDECQKARSTIEAKLGRKMNALEYRALTRLSNLTFMEMILQDFQMAGSPDEAEAALQNLERNAEDRFQMSIKELGEKLDAAFGVEMDEELQNLLKRKGNGIDLLQIQDDANEHKSVFPKFLRKKRVQNSLKQWEDRLRER